MSTPVWTPWTLSALQGLHPLCSHSTLRPCPLSSTHPPRGNSQVFAFCETSRTFARSSLGEREAHHFPLLDRMGVVSETYLDLKAKILSFVFALLALGAEFPSLQFFLAQHVGKISKNVPWESAPRPPDDTSFLASCGPMNRARLWPVACPSTPAPHTPHRLCGCLLSSFHVSTVFVFSFIPQIPLLAESLAKHWLKKERKRKTQAGYREDCTPGSGSGAGLAQLPRAVRERSSSESGTGPQR